MSEREFPFKRGKPVDGFRLRRKVENTPQSERTTRLKKSKPKRKSADAEMAPEVAEKIRRLEDYLLARGRVNDTVEQYRRVAVKLLSTTAPFTREGVDGFLADLRRRGLGNETIRWNHYVLRTCFRSWGIEFPIEEDESPRGELTRPPVLTEEQMSMLEETAKNMGLREWTLVRLQNCLGLRRGELRQLDLMDYHRPYLRVRTLKGGETVQRLLDDKTCNVIEDYLREHTAVSGKSDKEAFFVRGRRGPRLSLRGLNVIFARIRDRAGIEEGGFHSVRRGRVTELARCGMKSQEITKEFGWRSGATVERYIRFMKQDAESAIREKHPYFVASRSFDKAEAVKDESDSTGIQSEV